MEDPVQVPTPTAKSATAAEAAPAHANKSAAGRRAFVVLGFVALLAGGAFVLKSWLARDEEWTDDAQVEADVVPLSSRVAGQVQHVAVVANQLVRAGDVLAELDPADYATRLRAAEAELAAAAAAVRVAEAQVDVVEANATGQLSGANAQLEGSTHGVDVAESQVRVARAQLERADSQAQRAEADLERARGLREREIGTQAAVDDAQTASDVAQDGLAQAQAALDVARRQQRVAQSAVDAASAHVAQSEPVEAQIGAASAQLELARARQEAAEAAVEQARLALSYTRVTAPTDGVLSRLAVADGQFVQPGQTLVMLVPEQTWVVANFKETQVERMRPGLRAEITVDAYPGQTFEARLASLSAGTGARFSLLPPDNASGNFVKVVQRVPVRFEWVDLPPEVTLRAGLSAEVTVFLGSAASAAEPARPDGPGEGVTSAAPAGTGTP